MPGLGVMIEEGNGVIAASTKRVAAQEPSKTQGRSSQDTILPDGLCRVFGAGWSEPAGRRQERRDAIFEDAKKQNRDLSHDVVSPPRRAMVSEYSRRVRANCRSSSSMPAAIIAVLTLTTTSQPTPARSVSICRLATSRSLRLQRFLVTAGPILRVTVIPRRGSLTLFGRMKIEKTGVWNLTPRS